MTCAGRTVYLGQLALLLLPSPYSGTARPRQPEGRCTRRWCEGSWPQPAWAPLKACKGAGRGRTAGRAGQRKRGCGSHLVCTKAGRGRGREAAGGVRVNLFLGAAFGLRYFMSSRVGGCVQHALLHGAVRRGGAVGYVYASLYGRRGVLSQSRELLLRITLYGLRRWPGARGGQPAPAGRAGGCVAAPACGCVASN